MSIQRILDRNGGEIITIRATQTIKTAADRMRARGIAALVITDGDVIVGLVSERNIVRAISVHAEQAFSMTVRDVAPHAMITVTPSDSLKHAMSMMTNHRVRHLPVFADHKLAGIVSIGDVVKHRLEELEIESNVLRDAYIAAR